jgi:hypothetical protein
MHLIIRDSIHIDMSTLNTSFGFLICNVLICFFASDVSFWFPTSEVSCCLTYGVFFSFLISEISFTFSLLMCPFVFPPPKCPAVSLMVCSLALLFLKHPFLSSVWTICLISLPIKLSLSHFLNFFFLSQSCCVIWLSHFRCYLLLSSAG